MSRRRYFWYENRRSRIRVSNNRTTDADSLTSKMQIRYWYQLPAWRALYYLPWFSGHTSPCAASSESTWLSSQEISASCSVSLRAGFRSTHCLRMDDTMYGLQSPCRHSLVAQRQITAMICISLSLVASESSKMAFAVDRAVFPRTSIHPCSSIKSPLQLSTCLPILSNIRMTLSSLTVLWYAVWSGRSSSRRVSSAFGQNILLRALIISQCLCIVW